jgi:hypothetical protein
MILSAVRRHALPIAGVLLAIALLAGATHELCAHVLAFDWTPVAATPEAPVAVQLP